MKFLLLALFAFAITLGFTNQSTATTAADEKCKPEETSCGEKTDTKAAHGKGHEEGLPAKMNSLFPAKQPDPTHAGHLNVTETVAPAFLATVPAGSVQLSWKPTPDATTYHLQVATDPNFKWLVVNEKFVAETQFNFTAAEAGQRYFWRVAGRKADNNAGYTKANFSGSAFNVK